MNAPNRILPAVLVFGCLLAPVPAALAQLNYDGPPINYDSQPPNDPIAQLQAKIDAGQAELPWDDEHGYLRGLLAALDVPIESQVLVFSKTSFQLPKITPRQPRALYFSGEVYVGWVQRGDVIELSSTDPQQGPIFYTLRQREDQTPHFVRHTHNCTQCHASSLTRGLPGHIVRSVVPDDEGVPIFRAGTHLIDHTSLLAERWGGWYVTGTHGEQQHMGNTCATDKDEPESFDASEGGNRTTLEGLCDTAPYLSPHSDLVALMVLEHQTLVHNLIVQANYQARTALHRQDEMNRMLQREGDHLSDSTVSILDNSARRLTQALLFSGEAPLTEPIAGTSGYAEEFAARGPLDGAGRSLREFDLASRMFRYPCSHLIYSEAFDALPDAVRRRVLRQMWEVLAGHDQSEPYTHLSADDRQAILEILRETKSGLPDYWHG